MVLPAPFAIAPWNEGFGERQDEGLPTGTPPRLGTRRCSAWSRCPVRTSGPQRPLMISPDGGQTKLALFQGEPQGSRPTAGFHRVAFRVNGSDFLAFLGRAEQLGLKEGQRPLRVVDHQTAFSSYFADPCGHHLAVTTYDHEVVREVRCATPRSTT
jgi:hypothetical protein